MESKLIYILKFKQDKRSLESQAQKNWKVESDYSVSFVNFQRKKKQRRKLTDLQY